VTLVWTNALDVLADRRETARTAPAGPSSSLAPRPRCAPAIRVDAVAGARAAGRRARCGRLARPSAGFGATRSRARRPLRASRLRDQHEVIARPASGSALVFIPDAGVHTCSQLGRPCTSGTGRRDRAARPTPPRRGTARAGATGFREPDEHRGLLAEIKPGRPWVPSESDCREARSGPAASPAAEPERAGARSGQAPAISSASTNGRANQAPSTIPRMMPTTTTSLEERRDDVDQGLIVQGSRGCPKTSCAASCA